MIRLEFARAEDLDAIIAIDTLCAGDRSRIRMIDRAIHDAQTHIILKNDQVIGYAILTDHFFQRPFIDMLYIAEAERRTGIGTEAIQQLETLAQKFGSVIWTSTNRSNLPMQALLATLDYRIAGEVEIDADDPEIFYRKALT